MKKFLSLMLAVLLLGSSFIMVSCDDMMDGFIDEGSDLGSDAGSEEGSDLSEDSDGGEDQQVDPLKMKADELFGMVSESLKDIKDNYTTVAQQSISATVEGQSIEMTQSVTVKVDGKNVYFSTEGVESAEMEYWYFDGLCYMDFMERKIKYALDPDEIDGELAGMGIGTEAGIAAIPSEWLKDVETKRDDKGFYLEVEVDGEKFSQIYTAMGLGGEITGDVNYKIYFDAELGLIAEVVEYDMLMEGFNFKVLSEQKIVDVGTTKVSVPVNASEFVDMSEEVNESIKG